MRTDKLKREITLEDTEAFVRQHEEVKRWMRKIESELTRYRYAKHLLRYCEATEKTPKELIELKQNSKNHDAEDLLDEFVEIAQTELPITVIWNITKAVKSFYKWNYADLSSGAGKISVVKKKPYRTPDKDTLLRFMEGAEIRDKALIAFIASTGISEGSIPELTWKHIQDLEAEIPHIALTSAEIKGKGKGKYAGVEQHTFLTPYAKKMLLAYKEWRERKEGRKLTPQDYLFVTAKKPYAKLNTTDVYMIFHRQSRETGIHFSPHDLRRFVQTALEMARVQPNWIKKILRHKVSGEEQPYSQPKIEQLREAYRTALPYLDLSTETKIEVINLEDRKRSLIDYVELGTHIPTDLKDRYVEAITKATTHQELDDIRDNIKTVIEQQKAEDCQKIVTEAELPQWLRRGFRFVSVLPSGKILISNEA
ncbi:MAG: site-specific integrase [Candidatus Bathyarchaeia archaeon]